MTTPPTSVIPVAKHLRGRGILVCALLATCTQLAVGADIIRDAKLKISFMVPDGFVPVPEADRQPEFPYSFARDYDHPAKTFFIRVRGGGQRITGNKLSDEDLASLRTKQPDAERFTEEWKSARVDGIKTITDQDGIRLVHYALPLSTHPEAVGILVSGPPERDAEVRDLLKTVLRTFDGTPDPRAEGNTASDRFVLKNKHLILAGLAVLLVLVLWWKRWGRRHLSPPTRG